MHKNKIITTVSKLIFPCMIAFGFYIQLNGSNAPGGGFQAGVVMASAFFLYSIVFGHQRSLKIISFKLLKVMSVLGIMLYGGTGVICMLMGGEFLNYHALDNSLIKGQVVGISIIEWGVGLTVFSSFCLCYYAFVTRGQDEYDVD